MNERGHLSTETLDMLALSALAAPEAQKAETHLQGCGACKQRWDELNEDKQRFEQFVFPRTLPQVEARAKSGPLGTNFFQRWRMWIPALAAGAVAIVALLAVPQLQSRPYVGLKGGSTLEVVARRGGSQFEVKPGSHLKPGDQIRFVVEPAGAHYLLIASRDGRGNFSVYYPYGGAQSGSVEQNRQELPGAIELDEALGTERLFALFSDAPLVAEDIKAQLSTHDKLSDIAGVRDALTLEFVKEAP